MTSPFFSLKCHFSHGIADEVSSSEFQAAFKGILPEATRRRDGYMRPTPSNLPADEIEAIANYFAKQFSIPVAADLSKLVTRLGGQIEFLDPDEFMTSDSGAISIEDHMTCKDRPKFVIHLSKSTHPIRDRFTIAHELGHYVIHSDMGSRKMKAERYGTERVEREANRFAAALLMPADAVRAEFAKSKDVFKLASIFDVSTVAINARLQSLGLG